MYKGPASAGGSLRLIYSFLHPIRKTNLSQRNEFHSERQCCQGFPRAFNHPLPYIFVFMSTLLAKSLSPCLGCVCGEGRGERSGDKAMNRYKSQSTVS